MTGRMAMLARGKDGVLRVRVLPAIVALLVLSLVLAGPTRAPAAPDDAGVKPYGHVQKELAADGHAYHDAADHEHQFQALAPNTGHQAVRPSAVLAGLVDIQMSGLIRDGPRRPPRRL